jgi:predicted nuclease of predicted toxin-antitoxin system
MVRFKVDENLPKEIAELLKAEGHDAVTVYDQDLAGAADSDLSRVCRSESRVILTLDTDFSNIRVYPPEKHPGIIVLRLDQQDKASVLAVVSSLLPLLSAEPLSEKLWIVEPDRVRIWRHWE